MTQSESIRILYIEDDPGLARLVQKRLGTVGYTVDIASDGEEGLAKYQAEFYDLLFVDQSLPVHDGLEVIRILGSNGSLPPTVMITGTGDERVAVEAMKLGAGDYIVKDVEGGYLELLPSVVEKMLQQRRAAEEKQRTEKALRESQQLLKSTFASLREAVFIIDSDTVEIIDCNPAASEIFGYCREEMLGRTTTFLHVDEAALENFRKQLFPAVEEKGFLFLPEFMMKRKDGSVFNTEHSVSPLEDGHGKRIGWVSVVRDITDRKLAEEKLRASEERFRAIFETAQDFIFIKDHDSKFTAINPALERLYGVPASELIGKTLAPVVKKGMWARIKDEDRRVLNGEIIDDEHPSPIKGSSAIHHIIKVPMRNSSGEVIGICGICRDISERKRVELELRESEKRFKLLADNAPFAISIMAPDKTFEYFNPRFTEIFGYTKEDIPDKDTWFAKAYPDAAYRKEVRSIWEKDRNKKVKIGRENPRTFTVRCKNGQDKIIAFRTVDLEYGRQYLVYDDITDRTRSELALRESEERYRSLIDNIHLGINLIDDDFNILMVNAAQIEYFNKPAHETIGKKCFREFEKRDTVCPHCPGVLAMTTGEPTEVETKGVRDDGSHFQVRLQTFPVFAPDGTVTSFIEVAEDITARKEVEQSLLEHKEALENSFFGTAEALSKVIEDRDPYTSGHSAGVAGLAEAIARVMGLPEGQITGVYIAGVLHDIGKMAVPVEILVKPGRLTDMEMSLIQRHPEAGYEILKGINFPWPVGQATLQHHERMDGSGYPHGVKGDTIIREARILAVADVVDAMTHHRPYRPAFSVQDAIEEISKGRGRLYDPQVVDVCIEVLEGEEAFTSSVYSMNSTSPQLRRGSTKSSILPTTTVMRFAGRR
jgi:PAS domain S-box-containing protein/putative nucleotidyltransferase with HDIG domain